VSARLDARIALLRGLIDHAPLFPPASLDPPAALREDRRAAASGAAFALGRLVWPASRLDELPDTGRAISVVLEAGLPEAPGAQALEAPFGEGIGDLAGRAPEVYVEVPFDEAFEERLDEIARHGLRGKVRCGGSRVPSVDELAGFLRACRARGLPYKATAGLHHASPTNGEHGLLNLLAAAVFGDEESALRERDPEAFACDAEAFRWRGRAAGADDVLRARRERLCSVGSCSFFEPIEELAALGALPS
jgi:hypothetical protein